MKEHCGYDLKQIICRLALGGSFLLLSGCATYSQQMSSTMAASKTGSLDVALSELEKNNTSKEKDLLFYLEKGELLRMKGNYTESRDTWLHADEKIRIWEESVKTDPSKVLGNIGSFLINDSTRRYDGRDYEKVFVSTRLALDHIALGDLDSARTEIKKMHERESVIAEFRAKDLESAKNEAEKKGLKATSFKDLKGYPVETLDDPEVKALKNSYESAFANYLAGFVYETLGEPSLAAAGYRKAIEMHPGDSTLENGLSGLDGRVSGARQHKSGVDTLFVIETGAAPAIASQTLPVVLPIPSKNGIRMVITPISWPILRPVDASFVPKTIILDDKPLPIVMITNVDQMARRALSDEMPGIIFRSSVRAIAKGVAQKAVQDNTGSMGMFGLLVNAAASVAALVSEQADERTWRTLPAFYSVGRAVLPPGTHSVAIDTPNGREVRDIKISGSHAVVMLRSSGNSLYLAQSPYVESVAMSPISEVNEIVAVPLITPVIEKPKVAKYDVNPTKKKSSLK